MSLDLAIIFDISRLITLYITLRFNRKSHWINIVLCIAFTLILTANITRMIFLYKGIILNDMDQDYWIKMTYFIWTIEHMFFAPVIILCYLILFFLYRTYLLKVTALYRSSLSPRDTSSIRRNLTSLLFVTLLICVHYLLNLAFSVILFMHI